MKTTKADPFRKMKRPEDMKLSEQGDSWAGRTWDYPKHTRQPKDLGTCRFWCAQLNRALNRHEARAYRLAPNGVPRWVRCYDNGGESADRYTVVYTGRSAPERSPGRTEYPYRAMSAHPFDPQGIGQYGSIPHGPCDTLGKKGRAWERWPPAIGRKCHLGKRIRFEDLPEDCKRCVWQDYAEIWRIPFPASLRRKVSR